VCPSSAGGLFLRRLSAKSKRTMPSSARLRPIPPSSKSSRCPVTSAPRPWRPEPEAQQALKGLGGESSTRLFGCPLAEKNAERARQTGNAPSALPPSQLASPHEEAPWPRNARSVALFLICPARIQYARATATKGGERSVCTVPPMSGTTPTFSGSVPGSLCQA